VSTRFIKYLPFFLLLLALPLAIIVVRQITRLKPKADTQTAKLLFSPTQLSLPPDKTVSILINPDSAVLKSVQFAVNFDHHLLQLTTITRAPSAPFDSVATQSSLTQANSAGKFIYSAAHVSGAPPSATTFELIRLTFSSLTSASATASLTFPPAEVNIVDSATSLSLPFETNSSTITINATTPSLSPTQPAASITSTPTSTPTPTNEPNNCGGTCGSNYNCKGQFLCWHGYCHNPYCVSSVNCICSPTSTPTLTPTPTRLASPSPTIEEVQLFTPDIYSPEEVASPASPIDNLPTLDYSVPETTPQGFLPRLLAAIRQFIAILFPGINR